MWSFQIPTNFKESNLIGPRVTTCFVPPYKCFDGPTINGHWTFDVSNSARFELVYSVLSAIVIDGPFARALNAEKTP